MPKILLWHAAMIVCRGGGITFGDPFGGSVKQSCRFASLFLVFGPVLIQSVPL